MDEVNKEQAEKCRDLGAAALRQGDYAKACRMLEKSLKLYALPGVEALLSHTQSKLKEAKSNEGSTKQSTSSRQSDQSTRNGNANGSGTSQQHRSSTASTSSASTSSRPQTTQRQQSGLDGRAYTDEQVNIISKIIRAKASGRGAHYRVLGLENGEQATESDIKKAYRKISLKVHPDKNSAPGADEAFKAVGLAYATLSDPQKRNIYDRYGNEDPDNRGGGMRPAGFRRSGGAQEVSPEDIFNAFFGGGIPGGGGMGGPGFHVYTTGFGPGVHFQGGGPRRQGQQQQQRGGHQQRQQPPDAAQAMQMLMQFLPVLLIVFLSFFRGGNDSFSPNTASRAMPGENQYFSLVNKQPFTNRLTTKLTSVKEIPYFVSDKFLRTYYRDRYQLSQVERMVENAYENYLFNECQNQISYQKTLQKKIASNRITEEERARIKKLLTGYTTTRCDELDDFFPNRRRKKH